MALPELRKITQKRYVDAEGKRCKKGTVGAVEIVTKSACWYADIKPTETAADRIARRKSGLPAPRRKRVKLCRDKRAAQAMLADLIDAGEKQAAGVKDHRVAAHRDLGQLVDDFERHLLKGGKKKTDDYVKTTIARIQKAFGGCQFYRLSDIDCSKVETWLHAQRTAQSKTGAKPVKGHAKTYQGIADAFGVSINTVTYWRQKGAPIVPRSKNSLAAIARWHAKFTRPREIGATTSDHYVTALKRFGNWMVGKAGVIAVNPFSRLDKMNDDTELRKQRRIIEPEQFSELVSSARQSQRLYRGLTGVDRSVIYTLAAFTGLRASEIASLRPNSFDFGSSPTVSVKAAYTKNRKAARLPLKGDLAARLESYIAGKPRAIVSVDGSGGLIWPGTWAETAAKMIRIDLKPAGIKYTDEHGADYDFHALRHQFITNMFRAGIPLKVAQELARHSRPELTANIYAHLSAKDRANSVELLGAIPDFEEAENMATGTDGQSVSTQLATQELESGGVLRHKPNLRVIHR